MGIEIIDPKKETGLIPDSRWMIGEYNSLVELYYILKKRYKDSNLPLDHNYMWNANKKLNKLNDLLEEVLNSPCPDYDFFKSVSNQTFTYLCNAELFCIESKRHEAKLYK
jgi:hypothetical protein